VCPSRLRINQFITLLGQLRLPGGLPLQMAFLVECENFSTFNFRQTFAPWHVGDSRNMSGWCNINSNTGNDHLSRVNVYFCGTDISAQTCLRPPMYEDKINHWTHTFLSSDMICSLSKRKLRPIQPCFMCVFSNLVLSV